MSNPFAPPQALSSGIPGALVREGDLLVVPTETVLPARCVKCAAAADGAPLKVSVQWMPMWVRFMAFMPLPFLIAMLITRRSGVVHAHLCGEHRNRRRMGMALLIGSIVALIGGIVLGAAVDDPTWMFVGLVALVPMIAGVFVSRVLWAKEIDRDGTLRLAGAGAAFLDAVA